MRRVLITLILFFSNLFNYNKLRVCRYEPSCTAYAVEAARSLPPHKAIFLIIRRLLKCNPFGSFGSDPVPTEGRRSQYKDR